MLIKNFFLFSLLFLFSNSQNEYETIPKSDCGKNIELNNPNITDCIDQNPETNKNKEKLCCHLSAIYGIDSKLSTCILLENDSKTRIKKIKEINKYATKVKLDCGLGKKFNSDCGNYKNENNKEPNNVNDCKDNELNENEQCCLIEIKSGKKENEGIEQKFCHKFKKKLDINTIGEAVVAASTIDVDLKVNCYCMFINNNFNLMLMFLFFVF